MRKIIANKTPKLYLQFQNLLIRFFFCFILFASFEMNQPNNAKVMGTATIKPKQPNIII